nr:MAG TPA: hypothetical protein [Bacteriophage sp.]
MPIVTIFVDLDSTIVFVLTIVKATITNHFPISI